MTSDVGQALGGGGSLCGRPGRGHALPLCGATHLGTAALQWDGHQSVTQRITSDEVEDGPMRARLDALAARGQMHGPALGWPHLAGIPAGRLHWGTACCMSRTG